MISELPDVVLLSIDRVEPDEFDILFQDLDSCGISHKHETHTGGPYASLGLLIPTAVCFFITRSYFDGFLKEAGKQHYYSLEKVLNKLYSKFLGPNPKYRFQLESIGKKLPPPLFAYALSMVFVTDDGHQIKLLFQGDISEQQYSEAISAFLALTNTFKVDAANSQIAQAIYFETQHYLLTCQPVDPQNTRIPKFTILVYFDNQKKRFYQADPIASSKAGALVSRPLGEDWPNHSFNSDAASTG